MIISVIIQQFNCTLGVKDLYAHLFCQVHVWYDPSEKNTKIKACWEKSFKCLSKSFSLLVISVFWFYRNHLFRLNLEDLSLIQVSFSYQWLGLFVLTSCVSERVLAWTSVCTDLMSECPGRSDQLIDSIYGFKCVSIASPYAPYPKFTVPVVYYPWD